MTERTPEKVIRDGKVAILVSPGFGAGWSTWAHGSEEFVACDRHFVEARERNASGEEVEQIAKDLGLDYLYTGGWESVKIEWLPVGTDYVIHEYDGSESLHSPGSIGWRTA